jgi:asparagine synthase (glutamine-hydrolysing)
MCGIVGLARAGNGELLRAMNSSQVHRGPDDEGYYFDDRDEVALAMRRLSIIDVAGGHQPMASADGRLCIVFNGEIFNAAALRKELEGEGCRFLTDHSDTEVLVHLYARHGEAMLERLNGMFAFVIHNREGRRLFGARDHFGIKPFYYAHANNRFAFASELKSLRPVPWLGWGLDPQALSHYLSFQCVPSPRTIYRSVAKLPAAHAFTLDLESMALRTFRYWWPPAGESAAAAVPAAELPALVRRELDGAVDRWMASDVPVACSLSGGIDSTAILGLMAGRAGEPIRTYSLGFDDAGDLDERPLARLAAERWGTEHHEIVIDSDHLLDDLDAMIWSLDEPYAGGLPSWFVFKGMAGKVKVCMTGTGGDELFGNYGKWRMYESWRQAARPCAGLALRNPRWLADFSRHPRGSRYSMYFRESDKDGFLLTGAWLDRRESSEALVERLWHEANPATVRDAVRLIDMQIQLPDEFLHMTDRFSMAHSIEARTPFLDRQFAERMMALPAAQRIGSVRLKQVLVDAVRDLLPPELLSAPKKGFVLPVSGWLRGALRPELERLLGADYLRRQGIFRETVFKRLVRPHLDGQADHGWQLWTLLMFQLWQERSAPQ